MRWVLPLTSDAQTALAFQISHRSSSLGSLQTQSNLSSWPDSKLAAPCLSKFAIFKLELYFYILFLCLGICLLICSFIHSLFIFIGQYLQNYLCFLAYINTLSTPWSLRNKLVNCCLLYSHFATRWWYNFLSQIPCQSPKLQTVLKLLREKYPITFVTSKVQVHD